METKLEGPQTPFEVFCQRCKVTFPVGTRQCIHCGGRLDSRRGQPKLLLPPPPIDEVGEEGLARRGLLSPITALWLALAVAGALYRSCTTP